MGRQGRHSRGGGSQGRRARGRTAPSRFERLTDTLVIVSGPIGALAAVAIGVLVGADRQLVTRLALAAFVLAPPVCGLLYRGSDPDDYDGPMI